MGADAGPTCAIFSEIGATSGDDSCAWASAGPCDAGLASPNYGPHRRGNRSGELARFRRQERRSEQNSKDLEKLATIARVSAARAGGVFISKEHQQSILIATVAGDPVQAAESLLPNERSAFYWKRMRLAQNAALQTTKDYDEHVKTIQAAWRAANPHLPADVPVVGPDDTEI